MPETPETYTLSIVCTNCGWIGERAFAWGVTAPHGPDGPRASNFYELCGTCGTQRIMVVLRADLLARINALEGLLRDHYRNCPERIEGAECALCTGTHHLLGGHT